MNLSKKQKIGLAVAAVLGIGAVLYWRHKSASSSTTAASSSSDPNAIDPLTGLPFSQDQQTDPLTGLTYLGEAQQYGSVAAAEAAFSGASSESGYSAAGGVGYGGTAGYPTTNVGASTTGSYSTNAQWAQAVTAGLTQLGYSSTDIAAALGLFFAQQPLGSGADGVSYASIVQAAEAEFGPPPQGTYSIIAAPSSGGAVPPAQTGSPTPPATTTPSTPASSSGVITTAPGGFRVVSVTGGDTVNLAWNPVKGATGYEIAYGPTSGSQAYKQGVGGGQTSEASVPGVGAGSAGKHYFEIWALPAAPGGPHAGPIEATTTKS